MQKSRKNRAESRARPPRGRRNGAAADFAAAIARAEFGRFYVDEARLQEARRSVEAAIAQRKPAARPNADSRTTAKPATANKAADDARVVAQAKRAPWKMPSVRERRTEIAAGLDRLRRGRKDPEGGAG